MNSQKAIMLTLAMMFTILTFAACSNDKTPGSDTAAPNALQQFALIEVYSADNQKICEIEDIETLVAFNQNTAYAEDALTSNSEKEYFKKMQDIQQELEGYKPQYIIVSYKTPVGINNNGFLVKNSEITIYENTNMITEKVLPDTIKSADTSPEDLISYYEISNEKMSFLLSLADGGKTTAESEPDNTQTPPQYHIGNPRITKVEVYSTDGLINTILEQEQLDKFHDASIEIDGIYFGNEDSLKDLEQIYRIVAYKTDISIFGKESYQEIFDYTIYADTNIMKVTAKGMPLSLYYEATSDALDYLHSLIPSH